MILLLVLYIFGLELYPYLTVEYDDAANRKDSLIPYLFGDTNPTPPNDVLQPLKMFTESLKISNPSVKKIPIAFILMRKNGEDNPATNKMGLDKAKERNWKIYNLKVTIIQCVNSLKIY